MYIDIFNELLLNIKENFSHFDARQLLCSCPPILLLSGPILESREMGAIFQKKG